MVSRHFSLTARIAGIVSILMSALLGINILIIANRVDRTVSSANLE